MSVVLTIMEYALEADLAAGYTHLRVYRAPTVDGTYAALGTVALVAARRAYQYADAGGDVAKWYKVTRWCATAETPLSASPPVQGYEVDYCTLAEVRAEGVPEAVVADGRALEAIRAASEYIDLVTRQWFYPRALSFTVPGVRSPMLSLAHPLIEVARVAVVSDDGTEADVDLADVRVYNRHLTQGVRGDEHNPRLELRNWLSAGALGNGEAGVRLEGAFGWTDPARGAACGETAPGSQVPQSYGETPRPIRRAALDLVIREMFTRYGEMDLRETERKRWAIRIETTKDQSYTLDAGARRGLYTGDPDLDAVLSAYQVYSGMAVV